MAAGFAQYLAGDRIEALSGGSHPEEVVNPMMIEVMKEKGIDMEFRRPQSLASAIEKTKPERIITMGCAEQCPVVPNAARESWDIPDPAGQDIRVMRAVRDEIEKKVVALIETITH
jgi:protein-tyrosine-phosphatase